MCTNYYRVTYFKFASATAHLAQFLPGKLTFHSSVLKSTACVALVCKKTDMIRIRIIFRSFGIKKRNELTVTYKKLTNNSVSLVTIGLRRHVACRPSVGPHCST
jgi:hypothetical protein